MFYDVSVTRTSTASLTIRVEADDPETARGKALELAGDQDFAGCVVEYDFDAENAVEVKDENAPGRADETLPEGCDQADEMARRGQPGFRGSKVPRLGRRHLCVVSHRLPRRQRRDYRRRLASVVLHQRRRVRGSGLSELRGAVHRLRPQGRRGDPERQGRVRQRVGWRRRGSVEVRLRSPTPARSTLSTTARRRMSRDVDREYVVLNGKEYPAANEEERFQYSADEQAGMFFYE